MAIASVVVPWDEYKFDSLKALWVKGEDNYIYGYVLRNSDSIGAGPNINITTVDGSNYYIGLVNTSTIKDGQLIVTISGVNYKLSSDWKYMIPTDLLRVSTTFMNGTINSTISNRPGNENPFGFAIFGKDGIVYTSSAHTAITESFDIDITESSPSDSTIGLEITVTGLTTETSRTTMFTVPIDKIDPANPYLYLLYFNGFI